MAVSNGRMNMKKGGSDFSRRAVAIFFAVLLIAGVIAGLDYG